MINLLPPSFRSDIRKEENFRLLIVLVVLLFLFLFSLFLLLGSLRIYLGGEIAVEETRLILNKEAIEEDAAQAAIKNINKDIQNVVRFYRGQRSLVDVLDGFEKSLFDSMMLWSISYTSALKIEKKDGIEITPATFRLSGFAPTRELLFDFKGRLEENPLFMNVHFPPSNWVNAEDITFSVVLELTP